MQDKLAIIDIGSNTMRLVIYGQNKDGTYKKIVNKKYATRLRNYIDQHQNLNQTGIKILIDTIKNFTRILRDHSVNTKIVVATATIRNASNQDEIIEKIRNDVALHVRVLSEYEESYYGYLAVTQSTSITEGITIDIGGGSTEITYFKDRKLIYYHSFSFGVLSLKDQYIKGRVPTSDELLRLTNFLTYEVGSIDWIKDRNVPIIGIGGSARTVGKMDRGYKGNSVGTLHQYKMVGEDIAYILKWITSLSFEQLKKVKGLSKDRVDIIFPAIVVFKVIYQLTNANAFIISRKGLRDGLYYEERLQLSKIMGENDKMNNFIPIEGIQEQ